MPNADGNFTYTKDEKTYRVYGSNTFSISVIAEDAAGVASVSANSTSLVKGDDGIYTGGTASNVRLVGRTTITIDGPLILLFSAQFLHADSISIPQAAQDNSRHIAA